MTNMKGQRDEQHNEIATRILILTLICIALQVVFSIPALLSDVMHGPFAFSLQYGVGPFPFLFMSASYFWGLLIVYLVTPVVSCTIASQIMKPKRIISPLNVQVGTVAVFGMFLLIYNIIKLNYPLLEENYLSYAFVFGIFWLLSFMMFGGLGWLQTYAVRWIVRVNEGPLDLRVDAIPIDFETMKKMLLDKSFMGLWEFEQLKKQVPNIVILKRQVKENREEKSMPVGVVMVLVQDREHESNSIIASVAYDISSYELQSSPMSNGRRDSIVDNIVGKLPRGIVLEPCTWDRVASGIAKAYAYEVAESRLTTTKKLYLSISPYLRLALAATVGVWILLTVLFFETSFGELVGMGWYGDYSIVLFLALLLQIGLVIREERKSH